MLAEMLFARHPDGISALHVIGILAINVCVCVLCGTDEFGAILNSNFQARDLEQKSNNNSNNNNNNYN